MHHSNKNWGASLITFQMLPNKCSTAKLFTTVLDSQKNNGASLPLIKINYNTKFGLSESKQADWFLRELILKRIHWKCNNGITRSCKVKELPTREKNS